MGGTDPDGRFADDFDGSHLDTAVRVPRDLPMWISRAESGATYALTGRSGVSAGYYER
jgi:hypothetical protein